MCKSTMKKKHSEGVPFWILNDFNYEYIYIYLFVYLFMYFFYLMQSNLQVVAQDTYTLNEGKARLPSLNRVSPLTQRRPW